MLKEIIRDIIVSFKVEEIFIEDQTESIATDIKTLAKKLFFEGKINDLKDYIFDLESESHHEIENQFIDSISFTKSRELILEMKQRIQTETEKTSREKNIETLLEVLDYGHLKGFLSMFTV